MRTRTKICGITRVQDGLAAASAGADAIGLVFYAKSPRAVTVEQARSIVQALPPFVTVVGLFVDPSAEEVQATCEAVALGLLQFHGGESPEFCRSFDRPYIKAVSMKEGVEPTAEAERFHHAAGLLLDTYHPAMPGGSGESFDWSRVPDDLGLPLILAGGLAPENVAEAVRVARPFAVDASSGVEAAKGIKDAAKIEAFMRGVYRVE
ncbi:phosphoribosylanthranilate isomerase [Endothiovibrio diazotrophicus]